MTLRPPQRFSQYSDLTGSAHSLVGANTVNAQQHDLSPPTHAAFARRCDPLRVPSIDGNQRFEGNGNSSSCDQTCTASNPAEIPPESAGIFNHKFCQFRTPPSGNIVKQLIPCRSRRAGSY